VQTGTGQRGDMGDRPVAAKTGTSQDWRDAWFVGYSADFVTGVWLGNDDNTSMQKIVGGSLPASIWKNYMQAAHRNVPPHTLPGIDTYGSSASNEGGNEDNPWVDRGDDDSQDRRAPGRDRGVIEDFFDGLFGGDTALPAPPPPMGPRYGPRVEAEPEPDPANVEDLRAAEEAAEEDAVRAAEVARDNRRSVPLGAPPAPPPPEPAEPDGPYRQPEADPDEASPF